MLANYILHATVVLWCAALALFIAAGFLRSVPIAIVAGVVMTLAIAGAVRWFLVAIGYEW